MSFGSVPGDGDVVRERSGRQGCPSLTAAAGSRRSDLSSRSSQQPVLPTSPSHTAPPRRVARPRGTAPVYLGRRPARHQRRASDAAVNRTDHHLNYANSPGSSAAIGRRRPSGVCLDGAGEVRYLRLRSGAARTPQRHAAGRTYVSRALEAAAEAGGTRRRRRTWRVTPAGPVRCSIDFPVSGA